MPEAFIDEPFHLILAMAGHLVIGLNGFKQRLNLPAMVEDKGAPRMKPATLGRIDRARDITEKNHPMFFLANLRDWDTRQQGMGVGMNGS